MFMCVMYGNSELGRVQVEGREETSTLCESHNL